MADDRIYDAVIVGAGIVGATLAAILANASKRVAVVEARQPLQFAAAAEFDLRVSAINRFSQQTFAAADVWCQMFEKRVQPYDVMHVWDEGGSGEVRFTAEEIGAPELGHIIENRVIQSSLWELLESHQSVDIFCPCSVKALALNSKTNVVELDNGQRLTARLVVGADGLASMVRELSGINIQREDYGQKGIVATIKTEYDHQDTAWQRFLSGGPLALLPLNHGYSSIVWSLPGDQADRYLNQSDTDFCRLLSEASDYKLGGVTELSQRAAFPLMGSQASAYIADGVALIGDAAHTIHPLAGQGVNLGIKDAVVLSELLLPEHSRDWSSHKLLRRYERARKGENLLAMKVMEGFKHLFCHDAEVVKLTRNTGLKLFNSMPLAKQRIMRSAMGL